MEHVVVLKGSQRRMCVVEHVTTDGHQPSGEMTRGKASERKGKPAWKWLAPSERESDAEGDGAEQVPDGAGRVMGKAIHAEADECDHGKEERRLLGTGQRRTATSEQCRLPIAAALKQLLD